MTPFPSNPQHVIAPLDELRAAIRRAAAMLAPGDPPSESAAPAHARLERPKRAGQGDYSTNLAMLLAPILRAAPPQIADRVGKALADVLGDRLERFEVAGPGFVNLFMSESWHRDALRAVLNAGEAFGAGGAEPAGRVLVEFVSANPTGPVVAASGRHAAYGDALSRILAHHGHEVWREYYFNDAGGQIRLLGESVQARARGEAVPEGGYQGDYVQELAAAIPGVASLSADEAAAEAVTILLAEIKTTLERYGVHYDQYFSERALHEGSPSYIDRALELVAQAGHSYESDGALWLRTTSFGDDKDRVLRRSDGAPTYFAADLAYLLQKSERGLDLQLLPLGADHHGYVARLKAAFGALGGDPDAVEVPILQFVHLIEGKERAAMSKRRGEFITLDDLIDEIGVDATRFFMLQRSHDRTVDLDLELARRESPENPVYYVQYAHARIVSMLGKLDEERVAEALAAGAAWDGGALEDAERNLIKALVAFPDEIAEAAERRAPHRIAAYALELAQEFTAFYRDCKVIGAEPAERESFRIAVSQASRQTIKLSLQLLGVSAPDSM
ncbi:MAG TPA: arginine--tRNA ligase [Solirubrobacteraceae bacterium]|nr:arginine--tRNA ligase [Solirubrobacteraceae bacterium]